MSFTKYADIRHLLSVVVTALVLITPSCDKSRGEEKKEMSSKQVKEKAIPEEKNWSERMAMSIMHRNPEAWQIDDREQPKWDYVHGLVLSGFLKVHEQTARQQYFDYVKAYADELIDSTGTIKTYQPDKYNIDMINAGKILFELYEATGDQKYWKAMQSLRKQLQNHPRTASNGFWHKKVYPYQMWLDGLYMGAPFYARYTATFEEGKNLDDVAHQFELIQAHAHDPETGLLYHGWDESKQMGWADKKTGTSPNFWSRSLGWYAMALVDVLDYFPEDHPKKPVLEGYLNQLATALTKYQDESGLWYQVTDMGDKEGNYLEASGTAMFAYALAKGVNRGYLPAEFKEAANKAYDGLVDRLIRVADDGEVTITEACAVAGLGGDPYRDGSFEYYVNERKKDNDPKATGPFILAGIELKR